MLVLRRDKILVNSLFALLSLYFFFNDIMNVFPVPSLSYVTRLVVYVVFFVAVSFRYGVNLSFLLTGFLALLTYSIIAYYHYSLHPLSFSRELYFKEFVSVNVNFYSSFILLYSLIIYFKNEGWELMRKIMIGSSFLWFVYGLFCYFIIGLDNVPSGRFYAFSVEPSHFAFILGCSFFIIGFKKSVLGMVAQFMILFMFFLLTQAKFAVLAFPLSLISLPVFHFLRRFRLRFVVAFLILMVIIQLQELIIIFLNMGTFGGLVTYVTRFSFWFMGMQHLVEYPLGNGGVMLSTLEPYLDNFISLSKVENFNTAELDIYSQTAESFRPKDTFSTWIICFGWPGVIFLGFIVSKWLNSSLQRGFWLWGLTFYFIILELVTMSLTASGCAFQLTVASLLYVELRKSNEKNLHD